jgi:altronate dehydratase large subunit
MTINGSIQGFDHGNRGAGIRNYQLILPTVVCSTHVSRRIATEVGAVTFAHQHGCGIIGDDVAGIDNFFVSLADHPNVSSVLAVGLGCETIQSQELAAKLLSRNKSTQYRIIQESGGVEGTVAAGVKAAHELSAAFPSAPISVSQLRIGIDLGREVSDAAALQQLLKDEGCEVVVAHSDSSSAETFSKLSQEKVHLIISFPSDSQPASGFPLIPVINVAGNGALHQAIRGDFDIDEKDLLSGIVQLVIDVASGKETIAEKSKSGEIRAPRIVRSA